jgi:arsenate reductase
MSQVTIFHNPRCSKSRETLKLLEENGVQPQVVEYLKETPTKDELKAVLDALGLTPKELMRTKESEYKELGLDNPCLSDEQLLDAMISTPKLIERPIVIKDGKARIGRPPESVLEIL